ncbi:MAG TPA: tryptophanase, partial [Holophaga sp.]|nr:tryptophanase [Holophaga sp.]
MPETAIRFASGEFVPLEMHKVRVVQKLNLLPVSARLEAMEGAGFNTFLLKNHDVFLDMLTDSGTNAMSDRQVGAMMVADDAYAGSASFDRLHQAVLDVFGTPFFLPVHQGRAAEHIISQAFVGRGQAVPMNYHFTTTKAHVELAGGRVAELFTDEALKIHSHHPFKGNLDIAKLRDFIARTGVENIPYIRMEAGTNLIGGQPFSVANLREVRQVADEHGLKIVLDVSLLPENLFFIKTREAEFADSSLADIIRTVCNLADIIYFSARKIGCARGGGIATRDQDLYLAMRDMVPLFEGFLTYGGMSVREIEAMA